MGKVAIVTDSNSGITQAEGKKMGIYVLPMPFYINEELFYEDITLTQEEFYEKLAGDADIKTSQPAPGDVMDMWDKALEEYRFNDAAQLGYKFLWNEFCDWYLELIKPDMQDEARKPVAQYVLWVVLRELLLLLHPIIPFVTAEIWNALPVPAGEQPTDIALELYPAARPGCLHEAEAARMELVQGIIVAVRTIKAELNISPSHKVSLMLHPVDEAQAALLESCRQMMTTLARLEDLQIGADLHAPKASASSVVGGCQVIVPLKGAVDLAGELARLDKEMAKLEKDLVGVQSKLHNESFVSRAPAQVVERERARAEQLLDAKAKMQALRQRFSEALNEE